MIIWIASYPKSGNTWLRAFLSAYLYMDSSKSNFDFKLLRNIRKFPQINQFKTIGINPKNFDEVSQSWIPIQNKINSNKKINFLKTHNAFGSVGNFKFTNKENTLGLIHLVRDPRDVLISYNHHMNHSLDTTLEWLIDDNHKHYLSGKNDVIGEIVGSWSQHYNSWKSFSLARKITIKYEDLIKNPIKKFSEIISFLNDLYGLEFNKEKIKKCIEITSFQKLKKLEKKTGFKEKFKSSNEPFFKEGKMEQWKNMDNYKIIAKVELALKTEMKELNYI